MVITIAIIIIILIMVIKYLLGKNKELKKALKDSERERTRDRRQFP